MRDASDDLREILAGGSFDTRLIVDVFYGPDRTIANLGCDSFDLRWSRESDIKAAGTLQIAHVTDDGQPLVPSKVDDPLAPYGQEVNLLLEVTAGDFKETIPLGYYRIASIPSGTDGYIDFKDGEVSAGTVARIEIEGRLSRLKRWGFRSEENPIYTSAYDELARISGMGIVRTLADVTIPTTLVYEAVRGGRLKAVRTIANLLGGTEYVTPDGSLSVWPNAPGPAVAELLLGENGTVTGLDRGMDSEELYNAVVGDFETADRQPIHVEVEAPGLLNPAGNYGENTLYVTNPSITTPLAAQTYVEGVLAQVSSPKVQRITVQCVINPLLEDGDVVTVTHPELTSGKKITGQIVSHSFGASRLMTVVLDVIADAV